MTDQNCMSYWLPRLQRSGVKTPFTILVQDDDFLSMTDEDNPEEEKIIDRLVYRLKIEAKKLDGYPLFLRTGHLSGKHEWNRTCYVENENQLESSVISLIENSMMAGFMGLPFNMWALRELLPTAPAFTAFEGGLPICQERRYFFRDGKVLCHSLLAAGLH